MKITLFNKTTGTMKEAKIGFSWTTLCFGVFVPLTRSDWKWAAIQFLLGLITFGFSWLVMPFIYNKFYIRELFEKGYYPTREEEAQMIVARGIVKLDQMKIYKKINGANEESNTVNDTLTVN